MTDSAAQQQLPPPPPAKKSSLALILAILALVLVLLVSGAGGMYVWQQIQLITSQTTEESEQINELERQLSAVERTLQRIGEQQIKSDNATQQSLNSVTEQTRFHSETLAQLSNGNRLDWLLAETEYLLRLANQRLNLEKDVRGAELILASAEQVLEEIDDPAMQTVQMSVARELLALRSTPQSDTQSTFAQLQALISNLELLPEDIQVSAKPNSDARIVEQTDSTQTPGNEDDDSAFAKTIDALSSALRDAVKIRKVTDDTPPLLVPEQRYFLKQNLRLMYEQASLSLLNAEDSNYQSSLNKAEEWLRRYFALSAPETQAHLDKIAKLKQHQFAPPMPDISGSLRLLKTQIDGLYRQRILSKQLSPAQDFSLVAIKAQPAESPEPQSDIEQSELGAESSDQSDISRGGAE